MSTRGALVEVDNDQDVGQVEARRENLRRPARASLDCCEPIHRPFARESCTPLALEAAPSGAQERS